MMVKRITEDFYYEEFACKGKSCCGNSYPINLILVNLLQSFRNVLKHPIIITSGFRCVVHNREVKGHENSAHTYGRAIDFLSPTIDINDLHSSFLNFSHYKENLNIILYDSFIHIDNMKKNYYRGRVKLTSDCGD